MIGRIIRVPLREVWRHEALDFTTWLEENIDILSETIGMTLENAMREQSAGDFSVDLVAEDGNGNPVIIENQLEKSDHDHLGKIITYLTAIGAKTAIWIVRTARPEHIAAISWLNESSSASFYLIQVEAIRIGDSPPAPLLTLIVAPSEEGRAIGEQKKEMVEREKKRYEFWTQFLDYSKGKMKLFSNTSPTYHHWIGSGAGVSGLSYNFKITKKNVAAELYIDKGKEADKDNLKIFHQLIDHKEAIEKDFGGELMWEELPGRRACQIKTILQGGWTDDQEIWQGTFEPMVQTMNRLESALKPYIKNF